MTKRERIHLNALKFSFHKIESKGIAYYFEPIAIQRAIEINAIYGTDFYASNDYTILKGKSLDSQLKISF